jgi:phosphotransferase system HPr-like phosphotransfer protein
MLAAECGVEVEVQGEGADAEKAVQAIIALIERRFEEEE